MKDANGENKTEWTLKKEIKELLQWFTRTSN